MGEIKHLPTRQTMVDPKQGEPFARRQHFQPNKEEGGERVKKEKPRKRIK